MALRGIYPRHGQIHCVGNHVLMLDIGTNATYNSSYRYYRIVVLIDCVWSLMSSTDDPAERFRLFQARQYHWMLMGWIHINPYKGLSPW